MADSRWRTVRVAFSVITDVIITSLYTVKDFSCVSKLPDFINNFTIHKYFSFYEGNLDSANKFKSMTPQ